MKQAKDDEVYLVFSVSKDGVNIFGNSSGLKSMANLLVEMSESEVGDHCHLSVSMHELKKTKKLIIDFADVNAVLSDKFTVDQDVSIFKSDRPKNL